MPEKNRSGVEENWTAQVAYNSKLAETRLARRRKNKMRFLSSCSNSRRMRDPPLCGTEILLGSSNWDYNTVCVLL